MLTVVMYHYVRDLPRSQFPGIKGLLLHEFDQQLDYITAHYTVCSLRQIINAVEGRDPLPPSACLLTFDDGLSDHYLNVLPRLVSRGLVGSFFVPARPVVEHRVLDVHKIHFVLAAANDTERLEARVRAALRAGRGEYDFPTEDELQGRYWIEGRYDSPQVMFIKALLQHALPEGLRTSLVDDLFAELVSEDEDLFARDLYLHVDHIRLMADAGMEFGGHGYTHARWDRVSDERLKLEVGRTRQFLFSCVGPQASWAMSYPHGAYNATAFNLLRVAGCAVGFTTRPEVIADLERPLELSRMNTNDFPPKGPGMVGAS